jgi:hypothetical protein
MDSFDALVAAYEPGPGPGGLRALVSLAGRPLVEHQLRRVAAAGAERLLLLVDEVPLELAEVVTLLRREGLAVQAVAGLDRVAEQLSSDRPCFLLADACLAEETVLRRLAAKGGPLVATLPDDQADDRHERIDGETRWAGLALLDGARVADAAAMLGSWDPVSTLLRRAVQEGVPRIDLSDAPPVLLLHPSEMAEADRRIVRAAQAVPNDWVERWLEAPLLRLAVPRLVERGTAPEALAGPAAGLFLLAGGLALGGWRWPPLLLLLVSHPLLAAGYQLARVADRPVAAAGAIRLGAAAGPGLAVLGLGAALSREWGQWGWLLVGAALFVTVVLYGPLRRLVRAPKPTWLAGTGPLAWALLPFAAAAEWGWGLAALAIYGMASLFWLGRAAMRQAAADGGLPAPKLF